MMFEVILGRIQVEDLDGSYDQSVPAACGEFSCSIEKSTIRWKRWTDQFNRFRGIIQYVCLFM